MIGEGPVCVTTLRPQLILVVDTLGIQVTQSSEMEFELAVAYREARIFRDRLVIEKYAFQHDWGSKLVSKRRIGIYLDNSAQ